MQGDFLKRVEPGLYHQQRRFSTAAAVVTLIGAAIGAAICWAACWIGR